jgi:hypothetical protein
VPESKEEALITLREMILDRKLGVAGDEIVIKEFGGMMN